MRLRERLFPQWMWHLPPGNGQVALTFDDGPDPESTPRLLAVLQELQIPSTMFLTGSSCAGNEALVRECSAAGHSIAVHGYTHESLLWHSRGWQHDSISRTEDILTQAGVPYQRLFRPPFGHFNPLTPSVLRQMNFRGVLWSQLPGDWIDQPPTRLERDLISDLHDGSIIVLHDRPRTVANVIASLPALADEVRRRGWRFTSLSHPLPLEPIHL
jgi:peptidoglycan/xylan/chitin deacetylase (PgdA/CDA1 family)